MKISNMLNPKLTDTINTVIVDDNELLRKGLIFLLRRNKKIKVIGEYSNGIDLLNDLDKISADLFIIDIETPIINGIELLKIINSKKSESKTLILSMHSNENILDEAIQYGANGFALKTISSNDLDRAIKLINEGKNYFSEELLPLLTKKIINKTQSKSDSQFSKREKEILTLIAKGMSSSEIASELSISVKTVSNHRSSLNSKAGVKNTAGLLSFALKNDLIEIQ